MAGIFNGGTPGNDSILGTADADTLEGGAGNDTPEGVPGTDNVNGGEGDDTGIFAHPNADGLDINGDGTWT